MGFIRDDFSVCFFIWRVCIQFCWHTDVLDLLPCVRLWAGYIEGIYYKEAGFEITWLIFSFSVKYNHGH